jgi:hypothetical protein
MSHYGPDLGFNPNLWKTKIDLFTIIYERVERPDKFPQREVKTREIPRQPKQKKNKNLHHN